jgi:hypothetical protein
MAPKCNRDLYTNFLLSEPHRTSAVQCSRVTGSMSHDAITRFLQRESFTSRELFEENRQYLTLHGCNLSIDDCVLDKPYADPVCNDLVLWHYSGLHGRAVKGICLVTLFCHDANGRKFPINFRIYQAAAEGQEQVTKNDLFQEMMEEVLSWEVRPAMVTADAWYGSLENMKFLRQKSIHWLFGLKENRIVSETAHDSRPVRDVLSVAGDRQVHLRGYGQVRIIRRDDPHGVPRFYVTSMLDLSPEEFDLHHGRHWSIETYHRAIKQLCAAEGCSTRSAVAQKNHLFCVLRAFSFLERAVIEKRLQNWYELKRNLYLEAARSFIQTTGIVCVSA